MTKKGLTILVAVMLMVGSLTACATPENTPTETTTDTSAAGGDAETTATDVTDPTDTTDTTESGQTTETNASGATTGASVTTASSASATSTAKPTTKSTVTTKSTATTKTTKTTVTTKTTKTTTPTKPVPAEGSAEAMDEKADKMLGGIRNLPDTVKNKTGGTTYYIAPDGNNKNSGNAAHPWKDQGALNTHTFKAGDVVLFKRGGVYRYTQNVDLTSGVSYGAYGTGAKPVLTGSPMNFVTGSWSKVGTNLWKLSYPFGADVGLIDFNNGQYIGFRRYSLSEVKNEYDFYHSGSSLTVYLKKNPTSYSSIEIGWNGRIFVMPSTGSNITLENLYFTHTGGHALKGNAITDLTVRGCEFCYIGGSILSGYGDGTTRYGNAIEVTGNNVLITDCYINDIYDSGITYQGTNSTVDGYTIRNCLIEKCGMGGLEYWGTNAKHVLVENNFFRYAGYGFGGKQRKDPEMTAHIQSNGHPTYPGYNQATDFVIKNNIFEMSSHQLINATSSAGTPPTLSGNTYIQTKGGWLGFYINISNVKFDANGFNMLKNVWGDKTAKTYYR